MQFYAVNGTAHSLAIVEVSVDPAGQCACNSVHPANMCQIYGIAGHWVVLPQMFTGSLLDGTQNGGFASGHGGAYLHSEHMISDAWLPAAAPQQLYGHSEALQVMLLALTDRLHCKKHSYLVGALKSAAVTS